MLKHNSPIPNFSDPKEYPKNFSPVSNINIEFFGKMFWFKKLKVYKNSGWKF